MVNTGFSAFEARMRSAGLPDVAIRTFRHYHGQLLQGESGVLSEADIDPVDSLPDCADLSSFRKAGEEALARTVVVKLNGGLGTSMGLTKAKALLPVKDGLTFLDVMARQVLHHREEYGVRLPLVLMNSFATRDDSLALLRGYEGLPVADLPLDFLQHRVPKIDASDLSPVRWPAKPEKEWCPPGHGDIYTALLTSGMLATLLEQGYEYAFVANSDNLGAVMSLDILGWLAADRLPFLMEVTDRTESDRKGGHLARLKSGQLVLREVAQTPKAQIEFFQDIERHRFFNTNTLWINLATLARGLEERDGILGLPLIVNEKTVDPADDSSPRVYQLETAMGAAISIFEGAQAIRVPRERFVPVKTTNDLLGLWSDVYVLSDDQRVTPVAARAVGDLVIDLDPRYYRRVDQLQARFPKGPPSLVDCQRLVIRGDIRFGAHCVFLGEAELRHEGPEALVVPDGEVFD